MALSKQQWEAVEQELKGSYGTVTLRLEGRELYLCKRMVSESRLGVMVYIDGQIAPGWGCKNIDMFDPFVTKVWRRRAKRLYSKKESDRLTKTFGKRRVKELFPKLDVEQEWWDPIFYSTATLRRALAKNKGLELVCLGYQAKDQEATAVSAATTN